MDRGKSGESVHSLDGHRFAAKLAFRDGTERSLAELVRSEGDFFAPELPSRDVVVQLSAACLLSSMKCSQISRSSR
jgi:hypothetical protein